MSPVRSIGKIVFTPGYSGGISYKDKLRSAGLMQMPIPTKLIDALFKLRDKEKLKNPEEAIYEAIESFIAQKGVRVKW